MVSTFLLRAVGHDLRVALGTHRALRLESWQEPEASAWHAVLTMKAVLQRIEDCHRLSDAPRTPILPFTLAGYLAATT
jgi:hypothetical protein